MDSIAWKKELNIKKQQVIKYNKKDSFDKNFDFSHHKVESGLLYSSFIIRKLIESNKLSDLIDSHTIQVIRYSPIKQINMLHKWVDDDEYDWVKPVTQIVLGKDICNWLIHSYVLSLIFEENAAVIGFYVSSDFDRNKGLYEVTIEDWLSFVDLVIQDDIISLTAIYDVKKCDYKYTKKVAQAKYNQTNKH